MKAGGCSIARVIRAAPPAGASAAISEPMNGPLRSTTSEATTTIEAVIAILSSRPNMKNSIGRSDGKATQPRGIDQKAPADRGHQREGEPDCGAERLGGEMQHRRGEGEADQPGDGIGEHRCGGWAAYPPVQDQYDADQHDREYREDAA